MKPLKSSTVKKTDKLVPLVTPMYLSPPLLTYVPSFKGSTALATTM